VPIKEWIDDDGGQVTSAVLVTGIEPFKGKKDSLLTKHQKMFENAWWASGAGVDNRSPYLSRSELTKKLEIDGIAKRTIKNMTNISYDKHLIGALALENMIEKHENGWIVIDPIWSSVLCAQRSMDHDSDRQLSE
jgi:streptomycin 6-kinase